MILAQANIIAQNSEPATELTANVKSSLGLIFPDGIEDAASVNLAIKSIARQSNPSHPSHRTAVQDFQRLTISASLAQLREMYSDLFSLTSNSGDGSRGSSGQGSYACMLRERSVTALGSILEHSGNIEKTGNFFHQLGSSVEGEPYQALDMLANLAEINPERPGFDSSSLKIPTTTSGLDSLLVDLRARYIKLQPQVHALLDNFLTNLARSIYMNTASSADTMKMLSLFPEGTPIDPIPTLSRIQTAEAAGVVNTTRTRIVDKVNLRVSSDTLMRVFLAWEVFPAEQLAAHTSDRGVVNLDFVDAVMAIRARAEAAKKSQ